MQYSFPLFRSPNYYAEGLEKDVVVLHATTSRWVSAFNWLMEWGSNASAHGLVDANQAAYLVDPILWSWHSGKVSYPTTRGLRAMRDRGNPNRYTWGIEHCLYYDINEDGAITEDERQAYGTMVDNSVQMIRDFEKLRGKPFTEDEIITHADLRLGKPDLEITRNRVLFQLGLTNRKPDLRDLDMQIQILKKTRDGLLHVLIKMLMQKVGELRVLLALNK